MVEVGSAFLGKVGIEIYKTVGPKALVWVKSKLFGRTILFVGPARSGKTSLLTFIRGGVYAHPELTGQRTLKVKGSSPLQFRTPNEQIRIDVKTIVDTRGQDSPAQHAALVGRYRPHALCIVLDAEALWGAPAHAPADPDFHDAWLKAFVEALENLPQKEGSFGRRLKSLCIFVNKVDTVTSAEATDRVNQARLLFRQLAKSKLERLRKIANTLPLSMLETHMDGTLPVKAVAAIFDPFVRDS